jgi:hypothetical protein
MKDIFEKQWRKRSLSDVNISKAYHEINEKSRVRCRRPAGVLPFLASSDH